MNKIVWAHSAQQAGNIKEFRHPKPLGGNTALKPLMVKSRLPFILHPQHWEQTGCVAIAVEELRSSPTHSNHTETSPSTKLTRPDPETVCHAQLSSTDRGD